MFASAARSVRGYHPNRVLRPDPIRRAPGGREFVKQFDSNTRRSLPR